MISLNNEPINITRFPDNTSQCWKISNIEISHEKSINVEWKFTNEGEFLHLAQLKTLLDQKVNEKYLNSDYVKINLIIKYLPYGRQDKAVSNETTFALIPFARLLNSLNFSNIGIVDPHSKIALELINNSYAIYPIELLNKVRIETESQLYCYPDKGAHSKYSQIYDMPHIYANKVRDQLTGNILSTELIGDCRDKKVLIVDDICDAGGTFVLLAKQLYEAGAKEVNLFVSHGLFTKGLKPLKEAGINKIFSTDGEVSEVKQQLTYRTL